MAKVEVGDWVSAVPKGMISLKLAKVLEVRSCPVLHRRSLLLEFKSGRQEWVMEQHVRRTEYGQG